MGGNAINDFFDREADKISHPKRPLPQNKIDGTVIIFSALSSMIIGFALAFFLPSECVFLAGIAFFVLIIYSISLSGLPVIGNLLIAGLSGLAVLYGAMATNSICARAIFAGFIAGSIHLPREIFKDIEDIAGDNAVGRKTLPIIWNARYSGYLGALLCILAMIAIVIPYLSGSFGMSYMFIAFISFILCGMSAIFGGRGFHHTAQILLKLAMGIGILALWAEILLPT